MIVQNLQQVQEVIQKVLIDKGFIEFCQKCPIEHKCCELIKPFCTYADAKRDCAEDKGTKIGNKPWGCLVFLCPPITKHFGPEVGNWIQKAQSLIQYKSQWTIESVYPLEIPDFKE